MPKLVHATPSYRKHKPSGQAVVAIAGAVFYLGPFGSKASRVEYDRLIGEWLAAGRPARPPQPANAPLTITELALAYFRFAERYYVKDGRPTCIASIRAAMRILRKHYGHTSAAEFGPLSLKALQMRMVEEGHSRGYANQNTGWIKRAFKWAVANELVAVAVHQALLTVPGLRSGKTAARENRRVPPVADHVVEATIPRLPATVAEMVRLQRLLGCRPTELCMIRPCDVDTSGEVWCYTPESHKTQHHGRNRRIFIGPKAQQILRPYLLRGHDAYCFVPAESERTRNALRREKRTSPMTPSQAKRRPKRSIERMAGQRYTKDTYNRAICRAADKAFAEPIGPFTWTDIVAMVAAGKIAANDVVRCIGSHDDGETDRERNAINAPEKKQKQRRNADNGHKRWKCAGSFAELFPSKPKAKPAKHPIPAGGWHYMTTAHRWSPNQLRHSAGTEIRSKHGLEAAQVILGHSKADVTQVYAERDYKLAAAVAKAMG